MHDGQNVFNDATSFAGEWKADETAQRLIEAGTIEPVIIVAVANTGEGRMPEYPPTFDERVANGGRADLYARFLLTEVKPFIDKTYRTLPDREHTAVAGSSLGGLVSLHIARTYPDMVGKIAAVSPSLWWDDREMLRTIESDHAWTKNCRVWFDMGTAEEAPDQSGERTRDTRVLAGMFEKFGRQRGADFQYLEVPDGQHNEAAWAARFDQILVFLFGK
jgi:predicted alpha/beta superfamily hydrolase